MPPPGFRPILPVEPRPSAWYDPGQKGRGASAVCGATRTGPTPIAATLVLPIDSPPVRGVQRTLPLVAFLWKSKLPLPAAEKGSLLFPQPRHLRAVAEQAHKWQCGKVEEPFLSPTGKKWVLTAQAGHGEHAKEKTDCHAHSRPPLP